MLLKHCFATSFASFSCHDKCRTGIFHPVLNVHITGYCWLSKVHLLFASHSHPGFSLLVICRDMLPALCYLTSHTGLQLQVWLWSLSLLFAVMTHSWTEVHPVLLPWNFPPAKYTRRKWNHAHWPQADVDAGGNFQEVQIVNNKLWHFIVPLLISPRHLV